MGHAVAHMIGIWTTGVFNSLDEDDLKELKSQVEAVVEEMSQSHHETPLGNGRLDKCISTELNGSKGGFVVIAGVFNYWNFETASKFAQLLSERLKTHVMIMSHDHPSDSVDSEVYVRGVTLDEYDGYDGG